MVVNAMPGQVGRNGQVGAARFVADEFNTGPVLLTIGIEYGVTLVFLVLRLLSIELELLRVAVWKRKDSALTEMG